MAQLPKPNYAAQAQAVQREQTRHNNMALTQTAPDVSSDQSSAPPEKLRPAAASNANTVMVGVRITAQQRDGLKRLAIDKHTTVNNIVRELVERVLSGDISLNQ